MNFISVIFRKSLNIGQIDPNLYFLHLKRIQYVHSMQLTEICTYNRYRVFLGMLESKSNVDKMFRISMRIGWVECNSIESKLRSEILGTK